MKDPKKVKMGKASKAAGARFELKVRKDLESKGWICSKWMNNVEITNAIMKLESSGRTSLRCPKCWNLFIGREANTEVWVIPEFCERCGVEIKFKYDIPSEDSKVGKLISAKHKFRGPGIPMAIGTGFPDFIAFSKVKIWTDNISLIGIKSRAEYPLIVYDVMGVEVKSNGYLDKIEKEKCEWLLNNQIFSKILIASKGDKRGTIKYVEFK